MVFKNLKYSFLLFLFLVSCSKAKDVPIAKQGVLDLTGYNFSQAGNLPLLGEWDFVWHKFVEPSRFLQKENSKPLEEELHSYISVPSSWGSLSKNGKPLPGQGFATYHLRVLLPKDPAGTLALKIPHILTAYRFYIDGELRSEVGVAGESEGNTVSAYRHVVRVFLPQKEYVDFVFQVANFNYSKGGLLERIVMGKEDAINRAKFFAISSDVFLLGALLIMSVYHFGLYFLRKNMKAFLFFALSTLLFFIRIVTRGEMFIDTLFPSISFNWQIRLEYLSFYISMPIFYWFLYLLFPRWYSLRFATVLSYITAAFTIFVLVAPPLYFTQTLFIFQIITFVGIGHILYCSYKSLRAGEKGSLIIFMALFIFGITATNDILYMAGILDTIEMTAFGLFMLVFTQSFLLSSRMATTFSEVERLSKSLEELTIANSRFVPQPILNLLEKKSILDISLGDNMQKRMSLIFAELNNFQEISKKLDGTQKFNFINSYLNQMGPIVRNHEGFIDKYLGSGFMSIFPQGVDSMMQAGITIQKEISVLNSKRKEDEPKIEVGMGAHVGELMLGTIGEELRIDATVISDAVNISSRLKDLTKIFKATFIVSSQVKEEARQDYHFRRLGVMKIKGKTKPLAVYEVLDCYEPEIFEQKMETLKNFEQAIKHFEKQEMAEAKKLFKKVLAKDAQDGTAQYYLALLEKLVEKKKA